MKKWLGSRKPQWGILISPLSLNQSNKTANSIDLENIFSSHYKNVSNDKVCKTMKKIKYVQRNLFHETRML